MSASPVVFLQCFKIGPGLRRGIPKGFHAFFVASVFDPVGKAVREVFPGVGFGIVPQRRGGSFCTKELFMLCRESQHPIEKMSEFVERRAGIREVDGFLAVVGGSNPKTIALLLSGDALNTPKINSLAVQRCGISPFRKN